MFDIPACPRKDSGYSHCHFGTLERESVCFWFGHDARLDARLACGLLRCLTSVDSYRLAQCTPSYHHVSLGLMDAQTRVWVHLVCVGSSTVGVCRVCGHISMQLWVVICRWLGKHDGEVHALTKHAKLCLSSTPTKTGKAHKLSNLSRYARIVLKTSPGIAECERQKNA